MIVFDRRIERWMDNCRPVLKRLTGGGWVPPRISKKMLKRNIAGDSGEKEEEEKEGGERTEKENGWKSGRGGISFGENEGILASISSAINHFPAETQTPLPLPLPPQPVTEVSRYPESFSPTSTSEGKVFAFVPPSLLSPFIHLSR